MVIICWVKNRSKIEREAVSSWDTNPESNSCDPHWEITCRNKWHPGTFKISTPPEIAVGTHFHEQHDTNTNMAFLPADAEASWLLLSSYVSLLSSCKVQAENTYSCILTVTSQVWESQKRISINTNHSHHQHSSL